jgi:hypothetical protein
MKGKTEIKTNSNRVSKKKSNLSTAQAINASTPSAKNQPKKAKHLGVFNGKKFWATSVHFDTVEKGVLDLGEYHDGELKTTYFTNVNHVVVGIFKGKEQVARLTFRTTGDGDSLRFYRRFMVKSAEIKGRDAEILLEEI